MMTKWCYLVY